MPWPFTSGSTSSSGREDESKRRPISWANSLNGAGWEHYKEPQNWVPVVLLTTTILATVGFYRSYLRRIPTSNHVQAKAFRTRTVFGQVTSVGDGDNFHLFHTPGGRLAGWGWLRKVPDKKLDLKGKTIPIRLAGVDAPEGAHFGRPAQPFSPEALAWLSSYILGRRVRARIYKRDQYDRIVATVFVRRFLFRKDVGLEMLKRGLAVAYEAKTGAEFGGLEAKYKAAEAMAKAQKVGIWGRKNRQSFESPGEFKARMKLQGPPTKPGS